MARALHLVPQAPSSICLSVPSEPFPHQPLPFCAPVWQGVSGKMLSAGQGYSFSIPLLDAPEFSHSCQHDGAEFNNMQFDSPSHPNRSGEDSGISAISPPPAHFEVCLIIMPCTACHRVFRHSLAAASLFCAAKLVPTRCMRPHVCCKAFG